MTNCIVVVNYNDYKTTQAYIEAVTQYSCVDFVVIVDNCSTDNSYEMLKAFTSDKVHLVLSEVNGGYGQGNNLGYKYLKELVLEPFNLVVSNSDIIVSEESLEQLFKFLNENEDVAIASPTIKEQGTLNRGWKIPSVIDSFKLNIPVLNKKLFANIIKYNKDHYTGKSSDVEVVSGSIFAIKSDMFETIGMFDEKLFLYYEENVIALKLKELGKRIVVLNDVYAIHNHSVTIDNSFSKYNKIVFLKESQWYYHTTYSKANKISFWLLKMSIVVILKFYGRGVKSE